jgi:uncharacterized RDD family membrane protein YckC
MNAVHGTDATPLPARGESGPPGRLPAAGLWRRWMGTVYEAVVLFGVIVFFGYAFSALLQFRGEPGPMRWAFQGYLFALLGVYFGWFWSEGRRTLPMKTVSLQLVTTDDRPLSLPRALLRYLAAWLLLLGPALAAWQLSGWLALLLPVSFFWALFDRDRRALYDVLAGTRLVVREPAPQR